MMALLWSTLVVNGHFQSVRLDVLAGERSWD